MKTIQDNTKIIGEECPLPEKPMSLQDINESLEYQPTEGDMEAYRETRRNKMMTIEEIRKELDSNLFGKGDSYDYLTEADRLLEENGYKYTGAPCSCDDFGEYGHEFSCGFTRVRP